MLLTVLLFELFVAVVARFCCVMVRFAHGGRVLMAFVVCRCWCCCDCLLLLCFVGVLLLVVRLLFMVCCCCVLFTD